MNARMILPLLFGLIGTALLLWLGFWQLQRLEWKTAILNEIESRIADAPVALPVSPSSAQDQYLAVRAAGRFDGREIDVLSSREFYGAGYRVIAAFETDGRRVMVDRGFIATTAKTAPRPARDAVVVGNLQWPDETDKYTPAPDQGAGIWFARDVAAMARALNTEPVLIVARSDTGDGVDVFPVSTEAIPNSHLGYAITWLLLAVVWFVMTAVLLWRIKRRHS